MRDGTYVLCDGEVRSHHAESGYYVAKKCGFVFRHPASAREVEEIARAHGWSMFGVWNDSDGVQYIDPTEWVANREVAMRLGVSRSQIAIWDVENQTETFLDMSLLS